MCMFAGPVETVAKTRIYVGLDPEGGTQFTAYQMQVDLGGVANAMILAVPAAANDITLYDLSNCPDLFDKLENIFPRQRSRGMKMSKSLDGLTRSLVVHKIGSYDVSIAPTVADIDRANPEVFTLAPDVATMLDRVYPTGFAFLICQLRVDGEIHPLGYSAPAPSPGMMFVPTRHEHGDGFRKPHWDHSIYFQGSSGRPEQEPGKAGTHRHVHNARPALAEMTIKMPPGIRRFFYGPNMHKLRYEGRRENTDLLIAA